ncbi:BTB/POZ domain-containing protein 2-like [Phlebotomus papatasi]|uniref:BTB/POZ domain-containing protein 2-like n=1 Tax=Phlebotomus papatasi TaxID=29031 RepID=UPI002483C8B6|nr:BTB/POZ domain-containing protein 2-like [Phlebotomus papatasi]
MAEMADVADTKGASETLSTKHKSLGETPKITFEFPDNGGTFLLADKEQLVNISEVFEKQILSELNRENEKIVIKDISLEIFSMMIEFSYDGSIEIYEKNYLEILYAAKKYFYYDLLNKVVEFLLEFINVDNLTDHFEFIEKFELKSVMDHINILCIRNPLKVIQHITFTEDHMRILKVILESPVLPCTEYTLYYTIIETMKGQLQELLRGKSKKMLGEIMRKKLGPLIYLIRFPTMSVDELILCAKPPSLLKDKEIVDFQLWSKLQVFTETLLCFSRIPRNRQNIY